MCIIQANIARLFVLKMDLLDTLHLNVAYDSLNEEGATKKCRQKKRTRQPNEINLKFNTKSLTKFIMLNGWLWKHPQFSMWEILNTDNNSNRNKREAVAVLLLNSYRIYGEYRLFMSISEWQNAKAEKKAIKINIYFIRCECNNEIVLEINVNICRIYNAHNNEQSFVTLNMNTKVQIVWSSNNNNS